MKSEVCSRCGKPRAYKEHARCAACYSDDQRVQRKKHIAKRAEYDKERNAYDKQRGKRRDARSVKEKRQRLNDYKVDRGCIDCGYDLHPVALQFDHVRGEKKYNLGTGAGRSWKNLLLEIAKCEIRCANCHMIKTYGE